MASRRASHSASCHTYADSVTTEAVCGGTSVANAIGSAFSCHTPSAPRMRNLYRDPTGTFGRKTSHTPLEPIERNGFARPSQPSKSPVTRTPRAFGAHTANETPLIVPEAVSYERMRAPSTSHSRSWRPSPIRCRSSSPTVGSHRYGSSTSTAGPPL